MCANRRPACPSASDVRVTREVVWYHPSRVLQRDAEDSSWSAPGGRGGFTGLVFGSTGQHLLHHVSCLVAIVCTGPAVRSGASPGVDSAESPVPGGTCRPLRRGYPSSSLEVWHPSERSVG